MRKEQYLKRSLGDNKTERLFAFSALQAGLRVERSPSIRCPSPVENKNGDRTKTVTTPDYLVTDPKSDRRMYVEVTRGNGGSPSKEAQGRVIRAAGIANYRQLTGAQVETLLEAPGPEAIRARLFELFEWDK